MTGTNYLQKMFDKYSSYSILRFYENPIHGLTDAAVEKLRRNSIGSIAMRAYTDMRFFENMDRRDIGSKILEYRESMNPNDENAENAVIFLDAMESNFIRPVRKGIQERRMLRKAVEMMPVGFLANAI